MPDVVDYLGTPRVVTGAEYMDALARLGYNVENMSSPIPTMTKIASAQTNFLDNLYNQNIDRQAKQADLQYSLARANNLDSITDFNNQSLDLRLKQLDTENKQRQQQIDQATAELPLRERLLQNQADTGDLERQILKRQNDDFTQAQSQLPNALKTLPNANTDPDFKNNFDKWNSDNAGLLARTDSIGQQARMMRDQARTAYEGTSRFHQHLLDTKEFEDFQGEGSISKKYDADQLNTQNPDEFQNQLVAARALAAQKQIDEILFDPTVPQSIKDKLSDAKTYVHSYVTSDTGAQDIQKGKASLYFNPDGRLNPTAKAMIDGINNSRKVKPPEVQAKIPIPGVTGEVGKGEKPSEEIKGTQEQVQAQIATFQAQQAAEAQRKAEMADVPDTPENLEDKAAHQRGEISLQELHNRINARAVQQKKPAILPGKKVPGMQAGGLVQASYTPGSESQMLPGTEPEIQRQVQNAAKAEVLLRPTEGNAPYLGETRVAQGATDRIDWHNFNFGATQSFSGGPGFYNNPVSGKPYDTGDPALVGARVPMADLTRVLGTDAGSEKSVVSREVARGFYQVAVVKKDGTLARIPIVDVTPEGKNRGLELTPGAMKMMGAQPGDSLGYRLAFPDGSTIEPSFGGKSPIHDWLQQRDQVRRSRTPGTIALQTGGAVSGAPGPDQVPAMLTDGEFVMNKDAVDNIGLPALEALNAGDQPKFNLASGTSTTTGTGDQATVNLASGTQPTVSAGTEQDVQFQQPTQTSAFQQLFGGVAASQAGQTVSLGATDAPPPGPLQNIPVTNQIPVIRPQAQTPAPIAAQTPVPRALPAQTPAVTTGPTTGDTSLASTGGTTLMPKYTTGDAFLNAHYLGDGKLSGLATNFGHDVNGRPDTYMLSKLGGGSRLGAFGTDVVNPKTVGASVPVQTFRAFVGNPNDPQVRARVQSGRVGVEVWAPNGRSARFPIVDLGPGKGENASLDLTGSAMRQLGVSDNFGAVYRIYSQ